MEHPKWQRRTLLFGMLGAAARKLTALQPRRQQQESRFTTGLKRRFIETDNSGFDRSATASRTQDSASSRRRPWRGRSTSTTRS